MMPRWLPLTTLPQLAARLLGALLCGAALLAAQAPARAAYVLSEVTRAGAASMALWDINNAGLMVGYSIGNTPGSLTQAFVYDGSTFTDLSGPAGAVSSAALGLSDTGTVVGSYSSTTTLDAEGNVLLGPQSGFIYAAGSYSTFHVSGATETFLRAISPDGRYISGYYSTDETAGVGFVYDMVMGTRTDVSRPNSLFTIAQGINSSGTVVGSDILTGPPTTRPGFTYDIASGTRTDVALPGSTRTALRAIDDEGGLAGWFVDGAGQHGFVGSLSSYEQIDWLGATYTVVEGINNAGVLVGNFGREDSTGAFIAMRVPEPASWALVALALGIILRRAPARRGAADPAAYA